MTAHLAAQLLAGAAMVIVNVGAVPQLRAVLGHRPAQGVSLATAGVIVVSCAAWVVYSYANGLVLSTVSSVVGLTVWAAVAVAVAREGRRGRELWTPAGFAVALVAAGLIGGIDGLGAVLVAEVVCTTGPQLWRVHRHGVAGVSQLTWTAIAVAAACWLVYGIVMGDPALVASQGVRAFGAATIAAVVTSGRRDARSPAVVATR